MRAFLGCLGVAVSSAGAVSQEPAATPPDGADGLARRFVAEAVAVTSETRFRLADGREVVLPHLMGPDAGRAARTAPSPAAERASRALADLVLGRRLRVDLAPVGMDRMGRLRATVRPLGPDGGPGPDVAVELSTRGLVRVMPEPGADPDRIAVLHAAEAPARNGGRGLWGSAFHVRTAQPYDGGVDRFEIVEGTVARVGRGGDRRYLEFGADWREDFTAGLNERLLDDFEDVGIAIPDLAGSRVRVRGWVRRWNGAYLELREVVQLELID